MSSERSPSHPAPPDSHQHASLADLEAIRLLLRGGSVIDWHRLAFGDHSEVERFLRLNEFDTTVPADKARLDDLREEAVEYLVRNFGYRIPTSVAQDLPVQDLFLLASSRGREQTYACIVLKVMHVIHHLAGREMLLSLPVSDDELFGLVEKKVVRVVEELRGAGHTIVEFAWSRKERDSIVTKLLAKKTNIAANVFDKLRFRMVVRTRQELISLVYELMQRLVPFNYVVPGESVNGIFSFRQLVEATPSFARQADRLQADLDMEEIARGPENEFSGPSYRIINFVADLPIRLDTVLDRFPDLSMGQTGDLGAVAFVLTEFQITDVETARDNEIGENSHALYKQRQHERVKQRLEHGAESATSSLVPALPATPDDDDDDDRNAGRS